MRRVPALRPEPGGALDFLVCLSGRVDDRAGVDLGDGDELGFGPVLRSSPPCGLGLRTLQDRLGRRRGTGRKRRSRGW